MQTLNNIGIFITTDGTQFIAADVSTIDGFVVCLHPVQTYGHNDFAVPSELLNFDWMLPISFPVARVIATGQPKSIMARQYTAWVLDEIVKRRPLAE